MVQGYHIDVNDSGEGQTIEQLCANCDGVTFVKGNGYYALTKPSEDLSKVKLEKAVLVDETADTAFETQSEIFKALKWNNFSGKKLKDLPANFVLFVQSTSHNRKIPDAVKFLVWLPESSKKATAAPPAATPASQSRGPPQGNWRWCCKCAGFTYEQFNFTWGSQRACPAGGTHSIGRSIGGGQYVCAFEKELENANTQEGWRWCEMCFGLCWKDGEGEQVCPEGGKHDFQQSGACIVHTESGNDALVSLGRGNLHEAPDDGWQVQKGWRWCNKCSVLHYARASSGLGACAGGGVHSTEGSANYMVLVAGGGGEKPKAAPKQPATVSKRNRDAEEEDAADDGDQEEEGDEDGAGDDGGEDPEEENVGSVFAHGKQGPVFQGPGTRYDTTPLDGKKFIDAEELEMDGSFPLETVDCKKGAMKAEKIGATAAGGKKGGGGKKKKPEEEEEGLGELIDDEFVIKYPGSGGCWFFDKLRDEVRKLGAWSNVNRKGGLVGYDAFLEGEDGKYHGEASEGKYFPLCRMEPQGKNQNGSFIEVWGGDFPTEDATVNMNPGSVLVVAQLGPYPFGVLFAGDRPVVDTPWFTWGNSNGSSSWSVAHSYSSLDFHPLQVVAAAEVYTIWQQTGGEGAE